MTEYVEVEIRWPDVDGYGHVSHMALVTVADHARTQWLDRTLDVAVTWPYVIVRLELDFRGQAVLADRHLRCAFRPVRVGASSVQLEERVSTPGGQLVMETRCVLLAWDPEQGAKRGLTQDEAARFAAGRLGPTPDSPSRGSLR